MPLPLLGSHVERADPLGGAVARDAAVIQINLSAPQQWRAPKLRGDEAALAAAGIPVFVHAPYLVNCASIRAEIRDKSRDCLRDQLAAAATVGASGLVVHGGHPTGDGTLADGISGWLEVLDQLDLSGCRILIENTAGGSAAVARHLDGIAALYDSLRTAGYGPDKVGFVLDTCHAHAGGIPLPGVVDAVRDLVGTIDLVHLNDSKDVAGCGRDRHERLGAGTIDPAMLVDAVAAADAPCVVETPGGAAEQAGDLEWLRERLDQ